MSTSIKQIKDLNNTLHDLDNRSITLTSTSGTLTTDQLAILQESNQNYIIYSNGIYKKTYGDTANLYYQRQGVAAIPEQNQWFTITISTGAYTYSTFSNSDTKVTQSESSSAYWRKLILSHSGDGTPTAGITTATDTVYEAIGISAQPSTGTLRSTIYRVADNVELVYNSTTKSLDFNFL